MDVLLLQIVPKEFDPSFEGEFYAPIGIAYVAALLKQEKFSVEINTISCSFNNYSAFSVDESIGNYLPKIVGFSATGNELNELNELSKYFKNKYPNLILVAGGYCSLNAKEVLSNSAVDYVVIGEGEETMLELCQTLLRNHNKEIHSINGIAFKDSHGKVIINQSRTSIKDINKLPVPAYPNYPHNSKIIRVYASRGCPYKCTFCRIKDYFESPTVRYHDENFVTELVSKIKSPQTKYIYFNDDEFLLSKSHLIRMSKVARKFGLKICFQTRAHDIVRYCKVIEDNLDVINQIHMGIESFSQSQLDRWEKDTTVSENILATEILSQMGCSYYPYIILSDAETTVMELEENCKFLLQLPASNYEIEFKGLLRTITLSPLHFGVHLNRMKKFNGELERKEKTKYLDALWEFLLRTNEKNLEIIKLIRHASIMNPDNLNPLCDLVNYRISVIPEIAHECINGNNRIVQNHINLFHESANNLSLDYKAQFLINNNIFTNETEPSN